MKLFDEGWNKVRERIFANQKRLGVIPQDAKLPPWPKDVLKEWDTLSAEEQKLFIRQVEVFAAYAAYSDHEIGRVVQAFEDMGKLDNTLIIYINGDNGTSAEGGPMGTPNEVAFFNGVNDLPVEVQMKFYDVWGTEQTYNHMSAGWSWAFDTPFRWFKQNASQLGGVNQNMVVSWPARIKDKGGIARAVRSRDRRRADDPGGRGHPARRRWWTASSRSRSKGISFAYTFDANNAKAPSRHKTQYFEMMGQWALYDDGWFLSTKVNRAPWEAFGPANPDPLNKQVLELFNLNTDFNQTTDLAAKNPQKVKELKEKFIAEAKKHQVFPMDASVAARIDRAAAEHHRRSHRVRLHAADDRPAAGRLAAAAEHVLHDHRRHRGAGGRRRGHDPDVGRAVRRLRLLSAARASRCSCGTWSTSNASSGKDPMRCRRAVTRSSSISSTRASASARLAFNNFSGLGQPGTGTLKVDGKEVATKRMPKTLPMILQWDESFDIGSDTLTGVNDADYRPPFALTAKLNKLTIKVDRPQLSPADIKKTSGCDAGEGEGRLILTWRSVPVGQIKSTFRDSELSSGPQRNIPLNPSGKSKVKSVPSRPSEGVRHRHERGVGCGGRGLRA